MCDIKGINLAEFQKCGEIMVASKLNQLAISCNFCQHLFKQVQTFMRHLQQRHNDKLIFVKQAKEVEVYAVEELINQTGAFCVTDIESEGSNPADDSKWLSKEEMEWLEEGIVPKKNERHDRNHKKNKDDDEIGLDMTNMSILKALEDCDVSFNLMDNLNSTKRDEGDNDDNKLDNTLLREIQNDWESNDTSESIMQSIDCTYTEMTNISNHIMHISNELDGDVSMTDVPVNSTYIEKSFNMKKYNLEQSKGIKHLLQGLDDLEDVDGLLENLEGNSKTLNEIQTNQDLFKTVENNCSKIHQNFAYSKKILQKTNNIASEDFETGLKEIKDSLQDDDYLIIKNGKQRKIKNCKQKNKYSSKQRTLEETVNYDKHSSGSSIEKFSQNVINNCKITRSTDFEVQLKNLEESLNESNMIDLNKTKTKDESNMPLNDDLTRALADALGDEDIDLLNMQFEQENEEILNQEILSLLDDELNDKKLEQESSLLKQSQSLEANKNITITKNKNISTRNVIKSKYQKTNLKAKTKTLETQNKNIIQSSKSFVLQEFKTQNTVRMMKDSKIPLKGNHDIFLQQQQQHASMNNSLTSPAKMSNPEILNGRISNIYLQKNTPNKENEENCKSINMRNIKQEKFTPITSFLKPDRGDKTPVKKSQIYIKQSPKTQEKDDVLKIKTTPKRGYTPQEGKIKQSPNTQEKQEYSNTRQTPKVPFQKTPELIKEKSTKQSPKTQEKSIPLLNHKTTEIKNLPILKDQNEKTPKTNTKNSSEKHSSPKQTLTVRTPLTTPQRLKNVAIKLQRFSPEKLANQVTKQGNKSIKSSPQCMNDDTKQIAKHFKLPKGISLTKLHRESSSPEANNSKILETPVKSSTYCKQNFLESSLEPLPHEEKVNSSPNKLEFSSIQAPCQIINNLKAEANSSSVRQRKASIDILPSSLGNKQQTQMSSSKTPRNSNLDYKSYSVNRSARKKEVLQRMRNIKKQIFKSIGEGGGRVTKANHTDSSQGTRQKKPEFLIENVKILPNLREDAMTPLLNTHNNFKKPVANSISITPIAKSVSPKNSADDQKKANKSLQGSKNYSSINDDKQFIKKSLKRPASSPLLSEDKPAKRLHKSPVKDHNELAEKPLELESTQWNLSESVVDFLQRDLKENRLNVESILNENLAINDCNSKPDKTSVESNGKDNKEGENYKDEGLINDILKQVDNEKSATEKNLNENSTDKDETQTSSKMFEDFDDLRDLNLLANFGLKIIHLPEIEDVISLEERDEMNEKATKFANIYKNWQRIWSTKNSESPNLKQELEISFNQFLTEANLSFNLNLKIEEVKRLANLINIWYTHNFSNKLIEKQKISDSVNRYLLIFHFIPKTIKRFYYCEYCEEYFNTEHKYFTHRIIHTGALFPYTCRKCSVGFRTVKQLKNHETSCDIILTSRKLALKKTPNTNTKINTRSHKCHVCAELFATSELLYEHSKKHLKTIYNCAKCELVFATAIDVQNHMSICYAVTKRMPKQYTPRPAKLKAEPYSKK